LLKEERQAHAKASQQQLDKHAVEQQDGQQRTAGASAAASLTQLEDKVQVHSFTFLCLQPSMFHSSLPASTLVSN